MAGNYNEHLSPFDAIRHLDGEREYWLARELYKILGYNKWENFEKVIAKAKIAVKFNGYEPDDHLLESGKLIKKGKGATQEIRDVKLSRYACYIIVQNSDGSKPIVALAQGYFAVQTRRQELADAVTFATLSENEKRLIYREHLRLYNRKLHQLLIRQEYKPLRNMPLLAMKDTEVCMADSLKMISTH